MLELQGAAKGGGDGGGVPVIRAWWTGRELRRREDAAGIRVAIVEFDVADPEKHMLYSDAAACQLVPVLRAMLARLESGALRMPVDGRFRWEDVDVDP